MANIRTFLFRVLIILTLVYCMGAGLKYTWAVYGDYSNGKSDYVSEWESRMADLKKEIPDSVEKVGYVSDWDVDGFDKDAYIEFVLTQYALAPIRLERTPHLEWVIINSHRDGFLDWFASQVTETYTTRTFGNGIYLIHKEVE